MRARYVVAVLLVVRGDAPGAHVPLTGERCIMGRHPACQLVLDNPAISRHHAQVLESHGSYYVEDLRSRNGTYLNGKLLEGRTPLQDGDQVRISDVVLTFQDSPSAITSETVSSADVKLKPSGEEDLTPVALGGLAVTREQDAVDDESRILLLPDRFEEPVFEPPLVGEIDSRRTDEPRSAVKPETKLRAVLEIARALGGELRVDKLLPLVLDKLFGTFPQAEQGFILMKDAEANRLRVMATKSRTTTKGGEAVVVSMTVVRAAMDSGKALLSGNVQRDKRFSKSMSLSRMQIRSMMCVPLLDHEGESLGVIQVVTRNPDFEFTREDLDLLDAVAAQAALVIENAKMHEVLIEQRDLERDLEFATQVQLGFLPKAKPRPEHYAFADYYEAALRVGGDYFDYISLPDGKIAIAVGDVAGKGVPAALLMARLYASTRFQLLTTPDPAEAVTRLNAEIASSGLGHRFITFLVMVLDPATHRLTIVNAGHPPPLMRTARGGIEALGREASSLPLGILPNQEYTSAEAKLAKGSSVIAFTDGVTEAMSEARETYGKSRFEEYLKGADGPIDEVVKGLVVDVEAFAGDGPLKDDTCIVALKRDSK
ncbi:MAG: SpoIIE family protein phosphatase [Planctomycetaceae bacterium]|nr:SpoIIE family protein phosphatase [Planctomycetaceae bacterium]